jgi:hypothetical protein
MKLIGFGSSALAAVLISACGSSGPNDNRCDEALNIQVTTGLTPTFSWTPTCTVAQVRVVREVEGDDPEIEVWSVIAGGNTVAGPVTYGVPPAGTTETTPDAVLVLGKSYRLVIAVRNPDTGVLLVGGLMQFVP